MVEPSETPLGYCKKCKRLPLMKMDGRPKCPQCDTQVEEASGRVVNVSVSEDDFKLVALPTGYIESVPKDDPRPAATKQQIEVAQVLVAAEGKKVNTGTAAAVRTPPETPLPSIPVFIPPSQDGLLTLSHGLLLSWLSKWGEDQEYNLALTEEQLVSVYDFIDELPTPKSMKSARVLIKLQDRIAELLRR